MNLFHQVLLAIAIAAPATSYADDNFVSVVKQNGSVANYRLLPVHFDPNHEAIVRDRISIAERQTLDLPAAYQIPKNLQTPVLDQGQRGTCAYFATTELLESYYQNLAAPNKYVNISQECLVDVRNWMFDQGDAYTGDDKPELRPDPNGDLPGSIIKTIERNGVPEAKKFPAYNCKYWQTMKDSISLPTYTNLFTPEGGGATPYGKGLKFDQNTAPTIDSVKALIAANIPVEVGILVYESFMSVDDWYYSNSCHDKDIAGGHAIILTGYKTKSDGSTVFTFKNSWGAWGHAGYGTINDKLLIKSWSYDPSFDEIDSLH